MTPSPTDTPRCTPQMHTAGGDTTGTDCSACGRARCTGTAKGTGQRCRRNPHPGLNVCVKHGAGSPQARAKAERVVAERKVLEDMARAVATYGLPREVDPGVALLEEVCRTAGHVAWLSTKVGELNPDELVVKGPFGPYKNPILTQYELERKQLARVCADAVRIGLEARQVALAERLGEQVLLAMRSFAAELGHDPDDPKVVEAGARHLRAVAG